MQITFTGHHAKGLHMHVRYVRAHPHTLFNKLPDDLSKMRTISFILSLSSSYFNPVPPLSLSLSYTAFLHILFLSPSMTNALVPLTAACCILPTNDSKFYIIIEK